MDIVPETQDGISCAEIKNSSLLLRTGLRLGRVCLRLRLLNSDKGREMGSIRSIGHDRVGKTGAAQALVMDSGVENISLKHQRRPSLDELKRQLEPPRTPPSCSGFWSLSLRIVLRSRQYSSLECTELKG